MNLGPKRQPLDSASSSIVDMLCGERTAEVALLVSDHLETDIDGGLTCMAAVRCLRLICPIEVPCPADKPGLKIYYHTIYYHGYCPSTSLATHPIT